MTTPDDRDETWLRARLEEVLPDPPAAPDRVPRLVAARRRSRRIRAASVTIASAVLVGSIALAAAAVTGSAPDATAPADRTPATPAPTPSTTPLECPRAEVAADSGPPMLAEGAVTARLCEERPLDAPAPLDTLSGDLVDLDTLVDSVNAQPGIEAPRCHGPLGRRLVLLIGYPDGSHRHVGLDFSGCGAIQVGGVSRSDPAAPYTAFLRLLREQRATEEPPTQVPPPTCLSPYADSDVAEPGEMVAARLCVTYGDSGRTTSVPVPDADLASILAAWREGPSSPRTKGPGCGPTTPSWVLSGVTAWGDPVAITAECNQPGDGTSVVELGAEAMGTIERLVAEAGVDLGTDTGTTTAWALAQAWIETVNARALVSYDRTAAEIGQMADSLWVSGAESWLPRGALDWDLLAATPTDVPGWRDAWRIPARTPAGEAVFVVVRDRRGDPWRILSLDRPAR